MNVNGVSKVDVDRYPWTFRPYRYSPSYQNASLSGPGATPAAAVSKVNWWWWIVMAIVSAAVIGVVAAVVVIGVANPLAKVDAEYIYCNSSKSFTCTNGQCLASSAVCDDTRDCPDGSDELNCPTVATNGSDQTTVSGVSGPTQSNSGAANQSTIAAQTQGTATPATQTGTATQATQTANTDNPTTIPGPVCNTTSHNICPNGNCVRRDYYCDGFDDCGDNGDELNCTCSAPEKFECNSTQCIDASWRCDGFADCADRSDESNCVCTDQQFECTNSGRCIPIAWVCDRENDCGASTPLDEANCTTSATTSGLV